MPLTATQFIQKKTTIRHANLVALKISNGGLTDGELPSRLKLLNWGANATVKGVVKVGPQTQADLAANQKTLGFDRVALDFDHQTVPGSDTFKEDPVKVAAYGTPVVIPNDGLYLENIEWTPAGREYAVNYHDLSPTVRLNASGEVTFIHSAALCRQGAVEDFHFYNVPLNPQASTSMPDPDPTNSTVDYRALLVSLLGGLGVTLPDGASDADIATAVDQYKAPPVAAKDPKDDKKPAPPAAGAADPGVQALAARLDRIEGKADQDAKEALIALSAQQGKAIPLTAAEIKLTPLSVLASLAAKLPAGTVPLNPRGVAAPGAQRPAATGLVALSAAEVEICKNLKITAEQYLKHNPDSAAAQTVV
jgi:phage I-like protein